MEIYPTIGTSVFDTPIIAFDKIDGSNIRAEWTRKNSFTKFGSRRRLLDPSEPVLGEAVELIMNTYADSLDRIFRKERYEKATAFFEFNGEHSFAGSHESEQHQVTLLDIHRYKQGIITPREFLRTFGRKVRTANVLYEGKANQPFIESVRNSLLSGMTFEGVVCKGGIDSRNRLIVFKIKSRAWLTKLKTKCGDDLAMFESLL